MLKHFLPNKMVANVLLTVKNVIDKLGGFEFGASVKTADIDLTQLIAQTMFNFGVSPLFDMETTLNGKIGVGLSNHHTRFTYKV